MPSQYVDKFTSYVKEGQIERVVIHLPDNSGHMTGFRISPEYLDTLARVLLAPNIVCMTMSSGAEVLKEVADYLVTHNRRRTILRKLPTSAFQALSRAGSLPSIGGSGDQTMDIIPTSGFISCSVTPLYDHNVLLPNGDVALCCMDYGLKHILGNLFQQSYHELFEGSPFIDLLSSNGPLHKHESQRCSICRSCEKADSWTIIENSRWSKILKPHSKNLRIRFLNKIRWFLRYGVNLI